MTKRSSRPAVLHLRKLKGESGINLPSLSKARLKELIEQAIVDSYGEEEQVGGFFTMIEEYLALPFRVKVLGVDADVEKVDMTLDGQIVAICRRGKTRQKIPILDLPLPTPARGRPCQARLLLISRLKVRFLPRSPSFQALGSFGSILIPPIGSFLCPYWTRWLASAATSSMSWLVLHGCAHGRVSHDVHDREQVFGRTIHLGSNAMTRAVEDEVVWQLISISANRLECIHRSTCKQQIHK